MTDVLRGKLTELALEANISGDDETSNAILIIIRLASLPPALARAALNITSDFVHFAERFKPAIRLVEKTDVRPVSDPAA